MEDFSSQTVYDGFNYGENGIVLTSIDHLTLAQRNNQIETIANRNGGVLVESRLGVKPVIIEGYYIGTSISDAQLMYDIIAKAHNRQERKLTVPHAGGTRSYTATPENIIVKQPDGLNRITFSVEFVVPSGKSDADSIVDLFAATTITTASTTIPFTIEGSAVARPLITLTYGTIVGGTAKTMTVRNSRDFVGLQFTRDFVNDDVITIDSANFQVYINGVLTEPSGRMPSWSPGPGAIYYSDTFTSRTVTINATHEPRNL